MAIRLLSSLKRSKRLKSVWDWIKHYFGGLYDRTDRHHIFLMAGGLAFSLFVCIVPLILIVFSVIGSMLEEPAVTEDVKTIIDRMIPYQAYADYVKEKVFTRIEEFTLYKNLAGMIGFVGIFFAASGLFSSMRTILNTVYRLRIRESVLVGKLRDFGLVLLVLVYFLLSTMFLPALEVIKGFAERYEFFDVILSGFMGDLAFGGVSFVIILAAFFLMYWLVPQGKLSKKVIFISALWAAILWEIAKQVFGFYVSSAITLKKVYGAYIFLVVVGFWVYYTSMVFILGAEIGQLYHEKRHKSPVFNE